MPTYDRQSTIDAPLEAVWQFHSRIEGLEALTPDWMGLRVESMIGPDGDSDPAVLEAGTEISLSMRPFGIGPRQYVTSLITEREREDGVAYFRDEMIGGPFDRWLHTHTFFADGEETILRDRVEYELPYGGEPTIGRLVGAVTPFSQVGFEGMFRTRHRLTKARLE
ncbi:SRPBCC family protein [Natronorubrum texcoconense]|uniref:Ligand-binding SRPBCC domain-containing protein n=1 Tax=Natronorubrum texcoconense TaxID=1095776 RepID=A0A1G9ALI5_9EURY|nr:SRPBCC family protein [Natronorubrum texcoconense]SDK28101.1 Ligand-binding SRPBCC domain-containing protein [Natronorubrum texcoconense]